MAITHAEVRSHWESEYAASRQQGEVDRACRAWCELLAERTEQRRFAPDVFVTDGLKFGRDNLSEITDQRLRARMAIWIFATMSMIYPGAAECEYWEELAFDMAAKVGTPADNLAVGVVASGRRVWQGLPVGRLAMHKRRLDSLAASSSVNYRAVIAWFSARTHCDLIYQAESDGVAHSALLADCLERASQNGIDPDATPLGSAEFLRQLSSGKMEEASAVLNRSAHLAHRLTPYDAWMFWLYRTALHLAAGDDESALLDASRALASARQSGVPHAVFWGKLALARAFGGAPAGSGVWRRLSDARREARAIGSDLLVALCWMASAIVAARRGRISKADLLGRAALSGMAAAQMLRPMLFKSADFELVFRSANAVSSSAVSAARVRAAHRTSRVDDFRTAIQRSRTVEIRCLGAFSVSRDGTVFEWPRKAPRRPLDLLKATIAYGQQGASVEQLTDTLWPQMDGDRAHRAFGTALYRLRGLVGDGVLQLSAGRLMLDRERVWVDAFEFEDAVADTSAVESGSAKVLLSLYGGAFLLDQTENAWATAARDRLRELFRTTMRRTAEQLLTAGHWHDALDLLEEALRRDALAEVFYQRAIAACYAGGLRAEATAYYERCRVALSEHLGVRPSPKTESLYREVLRAAI